MNSDAIAADNILTYLENILHEIVRILPQGEYIVAPQEGHEPWMHSGYRVLFKDNVDKTRFGITLSFHDRGITVEYLYKDEEQGASMNTNIDKTAVYGHISRAISEMKREFTKEGQKILPHIHLSVETHGNTHPATEEGLYTVDRMFRSVAWSFHTKSPWNWEKVHEGGAPSAKVLYKGYYYKVRTQGRRRYITTKHEGDVPLSKVKAYANRHSKKKN